MKPKILLLNPPGRRVYLRDSYCSHVSKAGYVWHPIDLLVQSGILSQSADVHLIDAIASRFSESKVINLIRKINPGLILSLYGVAFQSEDDEFLKKIHSVFKAEIFVVGDSPLWGREAWLRERSFIKGVLTDYKSYALENYVSGKITELEKGIVWRSKDRVLGSGGFAEGEIIFPVSRFELFPSDKYWLPHQKTKSFYSIMTSFGCPYNCGFCPCENIPFTRRNVGNIIEELEYVRKLRIKELLLKDECFMAHRESAKDFLKYLTKDSYGWCFSAEVRLDKLSGEDLKAISKAGGHTLFFGVESNNARLLRESYNKDIDIKKLRENIGICRNSGIRTAAHYVLGLPGEDYASVSSTIELSLELNTDYASFNIATPLPGTSFWEAALKGKYFNPGEDLDSSCSFPVISTPQLQAGELWKLYKSAFRKFYFRKKKIRDFLAGLGSVRQAKILAKSSIAMLKASI
ncbi:MAG: radical SAM protein [Candidatus Omnitrophica bacterium]|nr:radical SAM protein [Candidatus Omnitrophota bacterium]